MTATGPQIDVYFNRDVARPAIPGLHQAPSKPGTRT